jgi:hypothetical protein
MLQKNHSGAFSEHVYNPNRSEVEVLRRKNKNKSRVSLLSTKSRPSLKSRGSWLSAFDGNRETKDSVDETKCRTITEDLGDNDEMIIGYGGTGISGDVVRSRAPTQ